MKDLRIYEDHNTKNVTNLLYFKNTLIFQSFNLKDDDKPIMLIDTKPITTSQIENTS